MFGTSEVVDGSITGSGREGVSSSPSPCFWATIRPGEVSTLAFLFLSSSNSLLSSSVALNRGRLSTTKSGGFASSLGSRPAG